MGWLMMMAMIAFSRNWFRIKISLNFQSITWILTWSSTIENVLCHRLGHTLTRNCRSSLPRDSLSQTPISPHLNGSIERFSQISRRSNELPTYKTQSKTELTSLLSSFRKLKKCTWKLISVDGLKKTFLFHSKAFKKILQLRSLHFLPIFLRS